MKNLKALSRNEMKSVQGGLVASAAKCTCGVDGRSFTLPAGCSCHCMCEGYSC